MGPFIFSKNLGMGFRLWLNPVKRPVEFLLLGMPLIAIDLVWKLFLLALDLVALSVKLVWMLIVFLFGFAKKEPVNV